MEGKDIYMLELSQSEGITTTTTTTTTTTNTAAAAGAASTTKLPKDLLKFHVVGDDNSRMCFISVQ